MYQAENGSRDSGNDNGDGVGRGGYRISPRGGRPVINQGWKKSRLKLNLCQPVDFINLSRFKPAFINKSRLKFRINEITENHSSKE